MQKLDKKIEISSALKYLFKNSWVIIIIIQLSEILAQIWLTMYQPLIIYSKYTAIYGIPFL